MKQSNITKGYFGDRLMEMIKEIMEDEKEAMILKMISEKQQLESEYNEIIDMNRQLKEKSNQLLVENQQVENSINMINDKLKRKMKENELLQQQVNKLEMESQS